MKESVFAVPGMDCDGGVVRGVHGLLADSLDMFADAGVYGLALYAVRRNAQTKVRTAQVTGWLQGALAICLWLVSRHREGGARMKASTIFSTNDVIANLGVIAAGVLVALTGETYPDLVVGAIIALVVLFGARRILRLR